MRKRGRADGSGRPSAAQTVGLEALDSYARVLAFLADSGSSRRRRAAPVPVELTFLAGVRGIERLYHTMSAAAPAVPCASDEEWNPLSQRPHLPLPPAVGAELGAEVTALKEAVDAFTTLTHEMLHVALWEPFFVGRWRPRGRRAFHEFSLMAEGFCFFFSDIVVTGAVRVRLPDGEFALDRQTPSNARFAPVRAFEALGMRDPEEILAVYLEGFSGGHTRLWQPRGTSNFAASLAAQAYEFYVGSLRYLDDLHTAVTAFGGLSEYYRRFCAAPGLPTFLGDLPSPPSGREGLEAYFVAFFRGALARLEAMPAAEVARVRLRRMLQMRAYYALQLRWLLSEGLVVARALPVQRRRKLAERVEHYLEGLSGLLRDVARRSDAPIEDALARLDAAYEAEVRATLAAHDAWVGRRWLIAPRRAGGSIDVVGASAAKGRAAKVELLRTVAFVVDELTRRMRDSKTVEERSALLAELQRIAALGAAGGRGGEAKTREAAGKLRAELARPQLLPLWSVPLAGFDPAHNAYRELAFSYQ